MRVFVASVMMDRVRTEHMNLSYIRRSRLALIIMADLSVGPEPY